MGFTEDLWLVLHLMIAGRLQWKKPGVKLRRHYDLASFEFQNGSLVLSETGSKKRVSLQVLQGKNCLEKQDPGGIDILKTDFDIFLNTLKNKNHTLKRALTDPHLLSGIGNAYSEEILHHARLSPSAMTKKLTKKETRDLYDSARETLTHWVNTLRRDTGDDFPEGVTAFREGMVIHGRFRKPCPFCNTPVQGIRYADNETNYCPNCQIKCFELGNIEFMRRIKVSSYEQVLIFIHSFSNFPGPHIFEEKAEVLQTLYIKKKKNQREHTHFLINTHF